MMKLKLEPNLLTTKSFKRGLVGYKTGQSIVITSSQRLLAPHLKLRLSTQVPIDAVNSKGFLKARQPNRLMSFLGLVERFGLSGKKKALFISIRNLFSRESHFGLSDLTYSVSRGSSLSSSLLIANTN